GAELVGLNDQQLASVELPESLREAVMEARRLHPHEALRRQLQFIGKLMRHIDPAPIRAKLDGFRSASAAETARLHRIERWRERPLDDPAALAEFMDAHPGADGQQLRTLIRNTAQERARGKPPKNFRALFQLIRDISEAQDAAADDVKL